MAKVHYIDEKFNHIFIIAKTNCKKNWYEIDDSTSKKEYVTCKKCLEALKD